MACTVQQAREAMRRLDDAGLALNVRWPGSKARYLLLLDGLPPQHRSCRGCGVVFEHPRKSRRICCSRSCGIAWSWKQPGVAERRKAAIRAEKATPEAKARLAAHNERRWSDPDERERLSEWNKKRWADPVTKAKLSASIQAVNGSAEGRKRASRIRTEAWQSEEIRERTVAGIRRSKQTPEARAKFSKLLKDRWRDPALRPKYMAAVKKSAAKRAESARGKKQSPETIAKRVESTRRTKSGSDIAPANPTNDKNALTS